MRLLLVDDEPAMLRSLRRTLRRLGDEQIVLEADPAAALARIAVEPFDLIISDMRMPAISGDQVLAAAATHQPASFRVLLSGYSGERETARAAAYAHALVTKPFEPATILELVERVQRLQRFPLDAALRGHLGQLEALPPSPEQLAVVSAALEAGGDAETLAALLSHDVALSARVMQIARSGFFGQLTECSLTAAVGLLGPRLLQSLLAPYLADATLAEAPVELAAWHAALNQEARELAPRVRALALRGGLSAELQRHAYLATLVHDVGRLVLYSYARARQIDPIQGAMVRAGSLPLCEAERATYGVDHGQIGAYLLTLWGFPRTVVEAVAWHHDPSQAPQTTGCPILALLHVADAQRAAAMGGELVLDRAYLHAVACGGWLLASDARSA